MAYMAYVCRVTPNNEHRKNASGKNTPCTKKNAIVQRAAPGPPSVQTVSTLMSATDNLFALPQYVSSCSRDAICLWPQNVRDAFAFYEIPICSGIILGLAESRADQTGSDTALLSFGYIFPGNPSSPHRSLLLACELNGRE